jgi:t-SNARE complex subunit (syntaxin)
MERNDANSLPRAALCHEQLPRSQPAKHLRAKPHRRTTAVTRWNYFKIIIIIIIIIVTYMYMCVR